MFEDTLAYQVGTLLNQPFSELLAADLDEDAQRFYARMASDIAVLSTGVHGPPQAPAIVQTLLKALAAAPPARAACWQQLYRKIFRLVASCDGEIVPDLLRPEFVRSLGRLGQFLSENVDMAEAAAAEDLKQTVLGRAAGV
jgi:hypothetical protein